MNETKQEEQQAPIDLGLERAIEGMIRAVRVFGHDVAARADEHAFALDALRKRVRDLEQELEQTTAAYEGRREVLEEIRVALGNEVHGPIVEAVRYLVSDQRLMKRDRTALREKVEELETKLSQCKVPELRPHVSTALPFKPPLSATFGGSRGEYLQDAERTIIAYNCAEGVAAKLAEIVNACSPDMQSLKPAKIEEPIPELYREGGGGWFLIPPGASIATSDRVAWYGIDGRRHIVQGHRTGETIENDSRSKHIDAHVTSRWPK